MQEARVLVVDDSAAMRALFCGVLEEAKNVSVIGTAANADEARERIAELNPNVVTLDVEMPGMSGIEFLEEIMGSKPLPVVMLSSLTQAGTGVSLRAYELGAVECFPKPLKATPEQFAQMVGQLGKIVHAAANSNLRAKPRRRQAPAAESFEWNGHIVAMSASMGGIDALSEILSHWPANCPPTVIVLQTEPVLAEAFIARMDGELKCQVKAATDGAQLAQGTVLIAADPAKHVVYEPGRPAALRMVKRDPIEGARPSANLLYGTIARAATPALGVVLSGMGADGARGLKLMRDAGLDTLAQSRATATVAESPAAAIDAGGVQKEVALDDLGLAILSASGTLAS